MKYIILSIILFLISYNLYAGGFRDHSLPGSQQRSYQPANSPSPPPLSDPFQSFKEKVAGLNAGQLQTAKNRLVAKKNEAIQNKDKKKIDLYRHLILIIEQKEAQ